MFKSLLAAVVLAAQVAIAAPVAYYSGTFSMKSGAPGHQNPVTGKVELQFDADKIALVKMDLDKAVMGKTAFESKEQYFYTLTRANLPTQLSAVFKVKGAPHVWFYVFVWDETATAGEFKGQVFKVKDTMDKIEPELAKGLDFSALALPTTWSAYGESELKALPH